LGCSLFYKLVLGVVYNYIQELYAIVHCSYRHVKFTGYLYEKYYRFNERGRYNNSDKHDPMPVNFVNGRNKKYW